MSGTLKYRFDYVKGQIDGHDYIGSIVKLKKVGRVYRGLCPIHGEKTPSFTVYPAGYEDKGVKQEHASFYCYGCDAGGDIFEFRKRHEHLPSTVEALKMFEVEMGIEIDDEEIQITWLQESINKIKNVQEQTLSISEINMACSSICRNYLVWVKENYQDIYKEEIQLIEKFYSYFDNSFNMKSAVDCLRLIDEVQEKIEKRRKVVMEKYSPSFD